MDPIARDKVEHLLALKVMRLTRPSLAEPVIVTNDQKDLPGNLLNNALKKDIASVPGSETIAASSFLVLPQCFGQIYLGETFSSYICVHNHSKQIVKDVTYKAKLQTQTKEISLSPDNRNSTDLAPGASVSEVIHHEVKEFGRHFLKCEIKYCYGTLSSDQSSFTKYFKFEVLKPLDVKTKLYSAESNEVFLEAHVQNITSTCLVLEKVALEPPPECAHTVTELNSSLSVDDFKLDVMAPKESKKFLYCMTPAQDKGSNLGTINKMPYFGKLDIVWRSNLGERGHLQTSQFQPESQELVDLHMSVEKMPNMVYLEEMFEITFRILNTTERRMDMILLLDQCSGFAWCGTSGTSIGAVGPGETTLVDLKLIPLCVGLQFISGVKVKETFLNRVYDFNDICHIFVSRRS